MKSVLISIRPKWCELIASGEKTVEMRKTRPNIQTPFKCYIYCTRNARDLDKLQVLNEQRRQEYRGLTAVCANLAERPDYHYCGNGKVIGEFVCNKLTYVEARIDDNGEKHLANANFLLRKSFLSEKQMFDYLYKADRKTGGGWAWHISDLKIYEKPKELNNFLIPTDGTESCCDHHTSGKHSYCYGCRFLNHGNESAGIEDDCNASFDTDYYRPMKRPPQSWCYVEEL